MIIIPSPFYHPIDQYQSGANQFNTIEFFVEHLIELPYLKTSYCP